MSATIPPLPPTASAPSGAMPPVSTPNGAALLGAGNVPQANVADVSARGKFPTGHAVALETCPQKPKHMYVDLALTIDNKQCGGAVRMVRVCLNCGHAESELDAGPVQHRLRAVKLLLQVRRGQGGW